MNISVDWLSFSLWHDASQFENDREALYAAYDILRQRFGDLFDAANLFAPYQSGKGRKPYAASLRSHDDGIAIYASAAQPHFLIELSGKGCEAMRSVGGLGALIEDIAHRVTRIDIACDMECATDPMAFANRRDRGRFKSAGLDRSSDGTTVYVGARKSNRWAKVYRYNEPHPRHHLLRAEHTFKAEDGKKAAAFLAEKGYEAMAAQCASVWGWKHPSWSIERASEIELTAHRANREKGKTVHWLYDTVGPLLAKLHREGTLSLSTFIEEAVLVHIPAAE